MQKLRSRKTVICRITCLMLLALGLLLWQAQAMAQVDSFRSVGDLKASIPANLEKSFAAKARQMPPPDDDDGPVETAYVALFADVSGGGQNSDDSDSSSGDESDTSGSRQEQEVLWYVGLVDPVMGEEGQIMQVSQTPAAPVPPSITADGSLVAFVSAEDNMICLVDVTTGDEMCDGGSSMGDDSAGDDAEDDESTNAGFGRQATSATGAVDVALYPDGSLLAYVPMATTDEPADYFVIRDLETGEEFPIEFNDDSGQSILQGFQTVDFSGDGMKLAFDAMAPFEDESGGITPLQAVFVWDLETGQLMGWGFADAETKNPALSNASSDFVTFEYVSGEGEEMTTAVLIADISQEETSIGGIIMSLPPAWPGFSADDMSLYFLVPLQDAETRLGIANIPVDLAVLEPAGDPALVMPDAIFGDAYAAGGVAGGGGAGGTGDDDDSDGDDDSDSDGSDDSGDSGPFPF